MDLTELMGNLRIELQDRDGELYEEDELKRAVEKSVSLMSRLIPERAIVETTIKTSITSETLTITNNTGTLAYKPVSAGTLSILGKTIDTHYTVDYMTGVVTEKDGGLPDTDYTVSYELDTSMLDISGILPDYIKIERVEYPVGDSPPTFITFDVMGTALVFRGTTRLAENQHLRIIYLKKWVAPTDSDPGDFPTNLNDALIIGSVGQALIFKAEKYTQDAAEAFETLTEPTAYSFVKPTSPTLPGAPSAPTAPTLDFTDAEAAMTAVATEITAAKAKLTSGEALINAATRGEDPAGNYGDYGAIVMEGAAHRVSESIARLRQVEDILTKFASEVTAFGSESNVFGNQASAFVNLFRAQGDIENIGANIYASEVNAYVARVQGQQAKASALLEIAGRFLASGQSKINEMLIMLGVKPEFQSQKASSDQRS